MQDKEIPIHQSTVNDNTKYVEKQNRIKKIFKPLPKLSPTFLLLLKIKNEDERFQKSLLVVIQLLSNHPLVEAFLTCRVM